MKTSPVESGLSGLLSSAAMLVNRFFLQNRKASHIAKYFLRGLSRQDMMMALTHRRRPWIRTALWLDEACLSLPDRFMGCTMTLMPLLEELCELAENRRLGMAGGKGDSKEEDVASTEVFQHEKAVDLRLRIDRWQPIVTSNISTALVPTLLAQASALRLAALLYLHRILHPPGSSSAYDLEAISLGQEVLSTLGVVPDKLKTMLWPVFIAACEMLQLEDRAFALDIFKGIYTSRSTATALAVKTFCVERVWQARDAGQDWDWMEVIYCYPGECTPI